MTDTQPSKETSPVESGEQARFRRKESGAATQLPTGTLPIVAPTLGARIRRGLGRFAVPLLLVALVALFSILRPATFATAANFQTILVESSVLAMLALAVMLPLIVGEFDLSLATTLGLSAMLAAGLPHGLGFSVPLTLLCVLAVGAVIGLLHSLLIVKLGLPSFVVTLGTNSLLAGMILLYSGGTVLYEGIPEELSVLGTGRLLGIGYPVIMMLIIAAVLWFVLFKRPVGRIVYATGANETAARLAGINTARVKTIVLIISPMLASFAGLILTARIGSANPTSYATYFLPAFAAAFLSLAVFHIGKYNPWGVVFSVYLLAVGVAGLAQIGVPSWVDPVFNGAALILAILLSRYAGGAKVKQP